MLVRAILVALFGLLASVQVVRTALISYFSEEQPERASSFWPDHPEVLRSIAMGQVGAAAGRGEEPGTETVSALERLAGAEPLSSEPLLVQSAIAQRSGDLGRAQGLLIEARRRDPRSPAARFLLADLYLRTGRVLPGLAEISVLGRLVPGAVQQVGPALASFAQSAGAAPQLKKILTLYPELEPGLLEQLAEEPRNAGLILSIANPDAPPEVARRWQVKLLDALVQRQDYAQAHAMWARIANVPGQSSRGLFNSGFGESDAPPPFNWTFASGGSGVAEPSSDGLRILYFGRDAVVLASQMMTLSPGRYRLTMNAPGLEPGRADLRWTIACLPADRPILELPLNRGATGIAGGFEVPASGCPAQRIALSGAGLDISDAADFRIEALRLERIAG